MLWYSDTLIPDFYIFVYSDTLISDFYILHFSYHVGIA